MSLRDHLSTFSLIAVCMAVFLFQGDFLDQKSVKTLLEEGANFAPYSLSGDPWRLVSSIFLHGGIVHLLLNMLALFTLGVTIEKKIGSLHMLLLFLVTGIAGNLASAGWNLFTISVGASGAIFGLFGFDIIRTVVSVRFDKGEVIRTILTGVIYVALVTIIGTFLPFDNAAHIGGLATGIILGLAYYLLPFFSISLLSLLGITIVLYFFIPRFQVIHFNQFQALLKIDKAISEESATFTTDEEAATGYKAYMSSYDSMATIFSDTLEHAPFSVLEDRKRLATYARSKYKEADYKVRLIREETFRYLDSIQLVQTGITGALNHPLALEGSEEPPQSAPGEVHRVWYDSLWKETARAKNAFYFRLGYRDSLDRWDGFVEDYYLNGGIQMKGVYKAGLKNGVFRYYSKDSTYTAVGRFENELRVGKWELFHENGSLSEIYRYADRSYLINAWDKTGKPLVQDGDGELVEQYSNGVIKSLKTYRDGLPDGLALGYYGDGSIKFREVYDQGELIRGRGYSENGTHTYDVSTYFPHPVGGMDAFEEYVRTTTSGMSLPPGEVKLLFACPPSGQIYDIRVWKGISQKHDSVAINLLKNGPEWIPAKQYGMQPFLSEGTAIVSF